MLNGRFFLRLFRAARAAASPRLRLAVALSAGCDPPTDGSEFAPALDIATPKAGNCAIYYSAAAKT